MHKHISTDMLPRRCTVFGRNKLSTVGGPLSFTLCLRCYGSTIDRVASVCRQCKVVGRHIIVEGEYAVNKEEQPEEIMYNPSCWAPGRSNVCHVYEQCGLSRRCVVDAMCLVGEYIPPHVILRGARAPLCCSTVKELNRTDVETSVHPFRSQ